MTRHTDARTEFTMGHVTAKTSGQLLYSGAMIQDGCLALANAYMGTIKSGALNLVSGSYQMP
jgi:hypothetical protein